MAAPISLFRPVAGERIDPTSIDATGATLGHVLTAVSDGSGGQRAGYAAPGGSSYTDENAQDAVGGILDDGGDIDFTYDDATPKITALVKARAVTWAKVQAMTSGKLLGRSTASSGDVEEITVGSGLSLSGGTLSASGSVSSVDVRKNSTGSTYTRPRINLIEGTGVTLTVADDSTDNEVDVTINASTGGSTPAWVANNPRTPPASPNAADREFKPGDTYDGTTLGSPATAPTILTAGGLLVTSGTSGGADQKGAAYTLPGGWVSVTTKVTLCKGRRFMVSGLHLRNSSTAKTRGVEIFLNTDDNFRDYWLESPTYTGLTTRTAAGTQWNYHKPEAFLRWRVSGSNIIGELSASGREGDWVTLVNEAASSHFSGGNLPDQAFLVIDMFSTVAGAAIFDFIRFT